MIAPELVQAATALDRNALRALAAAGTSTDARRLWRAWYRSRPELWLATYDARLSRGWSPGAPRSMLARTLASTPPAAPGRPPADVLALMGRGFGKTEIARGLALHRLIEGLEHAAVYIGATAIAAASHTRAMQARIPEYRRRESPADVAGWLASPLGRLYPDLRWTGDVTRLILLHEGREIPVWARGLSAQIRGLNERGVRPTLAILDDPQSEGTAGSAVQTAAAQAILDDEIGGLGDLDQPCARWVLANAIAQGDLSDRLESSGAWNVVLGRAWTPAPPPDGPHKRELLELLRAQSPAAPDYFAAHETAILQGAHPTDTESMTPMGLLALEASRGSRPFLRAYQCVRLSPADRLWPMDVARYVELRDGLLCWPDGHQQHPSACSAGIWLDPRYSDDRDRNDYAAAAAVLRTPTARRVVVALELERSATAADQRALYWRALDAVWAMGCRSIVGGYESNGGVRLAHAPGFIADAQVRARGGRPALTPMEHHSGADKYGIDRLERVAGDIETGALAFLARLRGSLGLQQAAQLPHAEHDDGADAIERADALQGIGAAPSVADWQRAAYGV